MKADFKDADVDPKCVSNEIENLAIGAAAGDEDWTAVKEACKVLGLMSKQEMKKLPPPRSSSDRRAMADLLEPRLEMFATTHPKTDLMRHMLLAEMRTMLEGWR